jgi:hypothetical protein
MIDNPEAVEDFGVKSFRCSEQGVLVNSNENRVSHPDNYCLIYNLVG